MKAKVLIAIPYHGGMLCDQFVWSLIGMWTYCMTGQRLKNYDSVEVMIRGKKGSILPNLRNQFVKDAREAECTHLLFVDSDQTYPPETLYALLERDKMIVGANIAVKQLPSAPTARVKDGTVNGDMVLTLPYNEGLEQVWRLGTGVMLIDMKVFDMIEKPYFWFKYLEAEDTGQGEDWGFCEKAEAAGIKIFVDHAISNEVGHQGDLVYTHAMVLGPMVASGQLPPSVMKGQGLVELQEKELIVLP